MLESTGAARDPQLVEVNKLDNTLRRLLSPLKRQFITVEEYDVLSTTEKEVRADFLRAAKENPAEYPWESVIYTLKVMQENEKQDTADAADAEQQSSINLATYGDISMEKTEVITSGSLDFSPPGSPRGSPHSPHVGAALSKKSWLSRQHEEQVGEKPEWLATWKQRQSDERSEELQLSGLFSASAVLHPVHRDLGEDVEYSHELPADDVPSPSSGWCCPRCGLVNNPERGSPNTRKDYFFRETPVCRRCYSASDDAAKELEERPGTFRFNPDTEKSELVLMDGEVPHRDLYLDPRVPARFAAKYNSLSSKVLKDRIVELDFWKSLLHFSEPPPEGALGPAQRLTTQHTSDLYRVERHKPDDPKSLLLYFVRAKEPLQLQFATSTLRQRFLELVSLHRRNPVVWAPWFCRPPQHTELLVRIKQSNLTDEPDAVSGPARRPHQCFIASCIPYEVAQLWAGIINLQNQGISTLSPAALGVFIPVLCDVYFIGLLEVPTTMRDGSEMSAFWSAYFGEHYYVILNTRAEDNRIAGIFSHRGDKASPSALVIVARKAFFSKMSGFDYEDIVVQSKSNFMNSAPVVEEYATFATLRIQENTFGILVANIPAALTTDLIMRNTKLNNLLARVRCGDPRVDISVRFDYFFILGSLGYRNLPTCDQLLSQIAGQMILSEFMVVNPYQSDVHYSSFADRVNLTEIAHADRVLFWHRPLSVRAVIVEYSTRHLRGSAKLGLPNMKSVFNVFLRRPYLSALCPAHVVAPCRIILTELLLKCETLISVRDAEVRVLADWVEGGVATIPVKFSSGQLAPAAPLLSDSKRSGQLRPLVPVCFAYEFLRAQYILLSLWGIADGINHRKDVIASSQVPLRDLLVPNTPVPFDGALVRRYGTGIGTLSITVTYQFAPPPVPSQPPKEPPAPSMPQPAPAVTTPMGLKGAPPAAPKKGAPLPRVASVRKPSGKESDPLKRGSPKAPTKK